MNKYSGTLSFHCKPDADDVLRGDRDMPQEKSADHVLSAIAFTARFVGGNKMRTHRVGIVISVDKDSLEDKTFYSPEMVDALLEQFFLMVSSSAGPFVMMEVLARRQQEQIENDVDDVLDDIGLGCDNLN